MSKIKKRPFNLKVDVRQPDNENRRMALCIISDLIYSSLRTSDSQKKETAFNLSKTWSVKEPPHFPIDLKEKATLIEKEARDGMDVFGDVNKIMDFYCPLLMKCSSQLDISSTIWLGWVKFKAMFSR